MRKSIVLIIVCIIFIPWHVSGQDQVALKINGVVKHKEADLQTMYNWITSMSGRNLSSAERSNDWVIEIKDGTYDNSNWHNVIWDGRNAVPNSGYKLTFKPADSVASVTIKGSNTVVKALRIGSVCENVTIQDINFDGFYRIQLLLYKCSACTVRNCSFNNMNREGGWCAINIEDCEGNWGNNVIENNTFQNLNSPGIALHAVYLVRSDNNQIRNNEIYYCSGGVIKCVDGSDYNTFDGNLIYDGCGDLAYFIGRNGTGQNILSKGNAVTNTQCLISDGFKSSRVYDNNAYRYIRKFVHNKESWSFFEYEWPGRHYEQFDSTRPFYIPNGHTGNRFNQIRPDFKTTVDNIIDEDPAYVYLCSSPINSTHNPLHRGKYEFDSKGTNIFISNVDEYYIYKSFNKYLNKIEFNDSSRTPGAFNIKFKLRTCEGEIINLDDASYNDGVLTLEKWLVEEIADTSWIYDIQGSGQNINFSNNNNKLMYLYTSSGNLETFGGNFNFQLDDGLIYKLQVLGPAKVIIRPQSDPAGIVESESIHCFHPNEIKLYQNYPNPFNPQTRIKYQIPKTDRVKIEVYNLSGQKIETLLDNNIPAGSYEVLFNGSNLSSGVYLYKIQAGTFQESKKMILLK